MSRREISALDFQAHFTMPQVTRRQFLYTSAPLVLGAGAFPSAHAEGAPSAARERPSAAFDFDRLREKARVLATKPYAAAKQTGADVISTIDFDTVQKIRFRTEKALWRDDPEAFPVALFHLDRFNPLPVQINVIDDGAVRPIRYSPDYFDYGGTGLADKLPADAGFSGFRVMDGQTAKTDWLAVQGASYFRSAGQQNQYGASARGIAIDTALATKEEFPRFVEFWLAQPAQHQTITIYALLDGPSLTGAYRFIATKRTGAIMDVMAHLFIRDDVTRLGVAPLTSMYWYGENDRRNATDWRPEIHDSDGLALWSGKGERIWRPLVNPPSVQTNSFFDENPRGFGLMQRDHDFGNYQDDGAFYDRRPSIWVEPLGQWGAGAVQLVEIPTDDEIHDNVVAYWNPTPAVKAGDQMQLEYRLYWQDDAPYQPDIARVTATRIGRGGVPGQSSPENKNKWKFVIDFKGPPLSQMAPRYDITPVVDVSRGKVENAYVIKIVGTDQWRALFDVDAAGPEQIDLRCFLRLGETTLTETWLYQYFPPP